MPGVESTSNLSTNTTTYHPSESVKEKPEPTAPTGIEIRKLKLLEPESNSDHLDRLARRFEEESQNMSREEWEQK
jgi:hypothetical protein